MEKIRIGIICPSEIAFRRFMPALSKLNDIYEFAGIAIASDDEWNGSRTVETKNIEIQKAKSFIDQYGGKMYESYTSLINDEQVEAVYIPLPPALHYQWAKLALQNNKHVFVEKPSSTRLEHTKELTELANAKKLVLHENYMFIYHHQIEKIQQIIEKGKLGDVRLIRANFGFPKRPANDFRYNKSLGGGALLDCGGYPLRLITLLLDEGVQIDASKLIYNDQNIDLYGSVQLSNSHQVAQVSFGMDNEYRCDLEIWANQGILRTGRIFSAPDQLTCTIEIEKNHEIQKIEVLPDDTFKKSLLHFYECYKSEDVRKETYESLIKQSQLVADTFRLNK